jgi:phytoene synthase
MDLLERHQVAPYDLLAGRSSAGLPAALAELRDRARHYLAAAQKSLSALAPAAIPAVLPVAVVRPALAILERSDPFAPAEIPAWRRQWLIWRAARNPARITG